MRKIPRKLLSLFTAALVLVSALGMQLAYAEGNTTLQISGFHYMEKDEIDSTRINFYTDNGKATKTGSLQVKLRDGANFLTPQILGEGTGAVYDMGNANPANVSVELNPNSEANYRAPGSYTFGASSPQLSSTQFNLTLAGGLIDGVNRVSVFLTNGPIDFSGDTLPSVEFGIGSGVTCEWGALS